MRERQMLYDEAARAHKILWIPGVAHDTGVAPYYSTKTWGNA